MRGWGRLIFVCFAFLVTPVIVCLAEDGDAKLTPTESETLFLDRLMRAEFGGAAICEESRLFRPWPLPVS